MNIRSCRSESQPMQTTVKMSKPVFFIFFFTAFALSAVSNATLLKNENTQLGNDVHTFDERVENVFKAYSHRDNEVGDVMLRYYPGKTVDEFFEVKLAESHSILKKSTFKFDWPTVFYIHGYKETADVESVHTVVEAYLTHRPNTNVILVDWSNMAFGSYIINAAPNTRKVAFTFANKLKEFIEQGLRLENVHIVGHSLGGQMAGFIGKEMKNLDRKLIRITALDPAFPLFYPGLVLNHISAEDADVVDVIHTDADYYGAPVATGTIDFWPNKGTKLQPGCPAGLHLPLSPEDLCSHWMSWRLWSDSLANPKSFPAGSKDGKVVNMGIDVDTTARGNFYLVTKDRVPYGMGMDGVVTKP